MKLNFLFHLFGGGYYLPQENRSLKTTVVRFYFQLMTFGKARVFYVRDEKGNLMHTSYLVPKCFKFPFMKKNDYEIGPCYTYNDYRGKGIYPEVIRYITQNVGNSETIFYMVVDSENTPSIRGVLKAGFVHCGSIRKSRIFKRYYREK